MSLVDLDCTNLFQGVTDPMLYIGMLFSVFAWHVEDHYLYRYDSHATLIEFQCTLLYP